MKAGTWGIVGTVLVLGGIAVITLGGPKTNAGAVGAVLICAGLICFVNAARDDD